MIRLRARASFCGSRTQDSSTIASGERALLAMLLLLGISVGFISGGACGDRGDSDGVKRLEFWTLALSPFEGYIRERIGAFEAANPGVKVIWNDVPFEAMDRKLLAAASAGRAPDVVNFSDKTYARFISMGALADLRPLMSVQAREIYLPGPLRLGEIDGKLLALPWYLTTQAVMANTQLLERGGVTFETLPRRWNELRAAARAYRARVGPSGPALFSVPLGTESDLPMMLMAEGHPPLVPGPDGRLRADLASDVIVSIVEDWVALFREGCLPRESATVGSAHMPDLYQNQRLAVINSGPNFLNRIRDVAPAVYDATRVGPPITGALGRGHVAVMVLGVTVQSRHPELAAKLALHMTSPESQELFCATVPILPSTSESLRKPQFTDFASAMEQARTVSASEAARTGRTARVVAERTVEAGLIAAAALRDAAAFTPALSAWPDMRRVFEDRIKRCLLQGADVRETLAEIEREWNVLLNVSEYAPIDAVPTPTRLDMQAGV